jgi:hypothetical protein
MDPLTKGCIDVFVKVDDFSKIGRTFFLYWPENNFGTWQHCSPTSVSVTVCLRPVDYIETTNFKNQTPLNPEVIHLKIKEC